MSSDLLDRLTEDALEYRWTAPGDFPADVSDQDVSTVLARLKGANDSTPTASGVRHWSAPELLATDFPEPRYAVPGIIPEGLTLLCSAPKFGKSWLTLGTAVALTSGGPALGRVPVGDPTDVLVLALEDPPRRLKTRLTALLGESPAPARLTLVTEWPPNGMDMVRGWLDEHPDATMVVVDVLARTRPPASNGESIYNADYRAVTAWKAIADAYGVAVVLVHHTRKAGSDDFLDTVSGTQGLAGAADAIIVLRRTRGSADAEMHVTGRDVAEATFALRFDPATGQWLLLDGPAAEHLTAEQRGRILEALRGQEGLGPKQIAEHTGLGYDVVRQLVRRMVDAGQLDTDGAGHYFHRSQRSQRSQTDDDL